MPIRSLLQRRLLSTALALNNQQCKERGASDGRLKTRSRNLEQSEAKENAERVWYGRSRGAVVTSGALEQSNDGDTEGLGSGMMMLFRLPSREHLLLYPAPGTRTPAAPMQDETGFRWCGESTSRLM